MATMAHFQSCSKVSVADVLMLSSWTPLLSSCACSSHRHVGKERRLRRTQFPSLPSFKPPLDQTSEVRHAPHVSGTFLLFSNGGTGLPPCYHGGQLSAKTWGTPQDAPRLSPDFSFPDRKFLRKYSRP